MAEDPNAPADPKPEPALDPAQVRTPDVPDPAEKIEEKGEPFDGNFA